MRTYELGGHRFQCLNEGPLQKEGQYPLRLDGRQ